jgi:hypothetical protein
MAEKRVVILDVQTGQAQKNVQDLNKDLKTTSSNLDGVTSAADQATGGAITKFKGLTSTIKGVTTGFKTLRGAIIATGIGALVIGVTSLVAAFNSSEEGQNKFAKILGVIGALTGNLVDLLADLGEKLIWVFENPKQALKDFGNLIKENISNRFEGLTELIPQLGKAIKLLFSGEFSEAGKVAGNAVAKVALGVDNLSGKIQGAIDKTKEFIAENVKEAQAAAKVADMRAKADKIERDLIVKRSKLESEVALLRLKARQEDQFSAEERKQALLDAQELEDQLLDDQTKYLELRRDAQILENTFSRTNKENLTKEAEAVAAVNNQIAARANVARQLQRELNTIQGQVDAAEKAKQAEKEAKDKAARDKEIADAKALADLKNQIREAEAVSEDEKRALEIIKVTEHYDKLIQLAKDAGLSVINLEKSKTDALNKITDKKNENEIAWAEMTEQKKAEISTDGFNNLSKILGEQSAAGKAAAIASATISTYQSATDSYKSLAGIPVIGPALGFAAAGAAIAAGVANVKRITSTKVPGGLSVSSPNISGVRGSAPVTSQAPQFNVVGTSGTNQLAETIQGKSNEPLKAYVVSSDVTSAQSLERNIVSGASI